MPTMARLFISQDRLDSWASENKVEIAGDTLIVSELRRSFRILPAVRFLRVAGSEADPHELLGTVKDAATLEAMGADLMADSVILGDTAYEVQTGFLGEPMATG